VVSRSGEGQNALVHGRKLGNKQTRQIVIEQREMTYPLPDDFGHLAHNFEEIGNRAFKVIAQLGDVSKVHAVRAVVIQLG
jgi:hypothetical protein